MSKKILFTLNLLIFASIISWVRAENDVDEKIVGGVKTDISKVPWQVSVLIIGKGLCGGSIIQSKWIVTAAHCAVVGKNPSDFEVHVGTNTASGGTVYKVSTIFVHPTYDAKKAKDDIALLKLSKKLSFNSKVKSIDLANSLPRDGTTVLISGYGHINSGGTQAPQLMSTNIKMVSFSECNKAYGNTLLPGMFCAAESGKDTCQGDSGGPVAYKKQIIGVVSFGIGCASPKYPGVYSSIPFYKNWISKTIRSSP